LNPELIIDKANSNDANDVQIILEDEGEGNQNIQEDKTENKIEVKCNPELIVEIANSNNYDNDNDNDRIED